MQHHKCKQGFTEHIKMVGSLTWRIYNVLLKRRMQGTKVKRKAMWGFASKKTFSNAFPTELGLHRDDFQDE